MSSSDSDSDVCNLFTDFSKKVAKVDDKFWSKFEIKNNTTLQDDGVYETSSVSHDNDNISNDFCEETEVPEESKEEKIGTVEIDETVLTKINDRIEDISETVKNILNPPKRGAKRKRGGKRRMAPVVTRSQTKRKKNVSQTIVLSDEEKPEINFVPVCINPVVSIKVLWKSIETNTFQLRKFDKLTPIKDYYVKNKNVDPRLIFFTLENREFQLEKNSFVSLRLSDDKIIEGSVLPETYLNEKHEFYVDSQYDRKFKVQINSRRSKPFLVKCKISDSMEIIFWQVILELDERIENVKLYFDGELLKPNDKIASLDLQDGDCFDLILSEK